MKNLHLLSTPFLTLFSIIALSSVPFVAEAQLDLGDVVTNNLIPVLKALVTLFIAVAVILFIIGVVRFIANADNESERAKGRSLIIWGIIILFVMVAVWGLVLILQNTIGIQNAARPAAVENIIPGGTGGGGSPFSP